MACDAGRAIAGLHPVGAGNDRYRTVVLARTGPGLRPGELLAPRAQDVDSHRRTVRIEHIVKAEVCQGCAAVVPLSEFDRHGQHHADLGRLARPVAEV